MKTVYQTQLGIEAHMILHLLQGAGMEGQVLGEHLQGGVGELPAAGLVRVVVPDELEAEARDVIADWESRQVPEGSSPRRSGSQWWALVATAFLLGAISGAFIAWGALRTAQV